MLAWIGRALAVVSREVGSALVEFFEDEADPGSKAMGDAIKEAGARRIRASTGAATIR